MMSDRVIEIDTITQFVCTTQHYELDRINFREKKDQIFSVQEKSRFSRDKNTNTELSQRDNYQSQTSLKQGKMSVPIINFILRLNSGAHVNSIAQDTKQNFANVMVLDISNARIGNLPDTVIYQMPSLQVLNLQNNLLTELPTSVYQANLVQLNVNNNLLKSFQCEAPWQQNLERLDVAKNHVRPLPTGLWRCYKLATLDIRSNDFDSISEEILNLKDQLSALGLDWVKYSLTEYKPQRNDIIRDEALQIFWDTLNMILVEESSLTVCDNESNIGRKQISCSLFIQKYDQLIMQEHEKVQVLQVLDDEEELHEEYHSGESKPNTLNIRPLSDSQDLARTEYIQGDHLNEQEEMIESPQTEQFIGEEIESVEKVKKKVFNIIHMTVINEDLGVLRSLLVTQLKLAQQVDEHNHTPLSLAIQEEKYHCAKILLNSKVDVNLGGGTFGSCINLAVNKVQYFLLRDLISNDCNVHAVDRQGNGPLHLLIPAFKRSSMEAVKIAYLLIESGANPNLRNNNGQTPLQLAIKKNVFQAVKFALQYNQDFGCTIFDFKVYTIKDNQSLLHLACKSESIRCILLVGFLQPNNLFDYNSYGVRPFDQIQKNYTLSKLLQIMESSYIRQIFQKKRKLEQKVEIIAKPTESVQPRKLSHSVQDFVDENDEFGDAGQQIVQGMAQMRMSPRFQKLGTQTKRAMKSNDSRRSLSRNQREKDKISQENVNKIHIHSSTQQRNDLGKLERYNKSLMSSKTLTKFQTSHSRKQGTAIVSQMIELTHRCKETTSLVDHIIIKETKSILDRELSFIETQDTMKIKLENVIEILNAQSCMLRDSLNEIWLNYDVKLLNNLERDLTIRNTIIDVKDMDIFCQYEKLQQKTK